jgi:hypothetical protein
MRAAHEAVKGAVEGESKDHLPGDEDQTPNGDSDLVQASNGVGESEGATNGRSLTSMRLRARAAALGL